MTTLSQRTTAKKLVSGYIRRIQISEFHSHSIYTAIPSSIVKLCFSFYYPGSGRITRTFKAVLLGASGVGKSSIVMALNNDPFEENHISTIGAMFRGFSMIVDDYTIHYQIWDTAGQERFMSVMPMYYRGANIALFVFDVTKKESFQRVKFWMEQFEENMDIENVIMAICANKSDLECKVDITKVQKYAEDNNCLFFMTSAKTKYNIATLFCETGYKAATTFSNDADSSLVCHLHDDGILLRERKRGCAC